ncbi:ATP-binding protein [Hamadaea tsunoensis]|uniref:ATP-binding protein n=1 Tax=Hamadaea tsunoensis TaxID=53368 RepID=UPI000402C02D|nr:ATP-binding protein [Hamadaea tsunoensis]
MVDEITALGSLRFGWAVVADDVWNPDFEYVEGLHPEVERAITNGIADADADVRSNPIGIALQGQKGTGKTHILGWTRQQVYAKDGYFFLVSLLEGRSFWTSVLHSLNQGLTRVAGGSESQLRVLMRRLGDVVQAPRRVRRAIVGDAPISTAILDEFIQLLKNHDPLVGRECSDTARALALLLSDSSLSQEVGDTYLQSSEDEQGDRAQWGMRRKPRDPELVVQDLSWLMALTGPTVIAVDQIDAIVAQSVKELDERGTLEPGQDLLVERVAGGLMMLRERTRRTLTVVSCIPDSWVLIKTRAVNPAEDRFRQSKHLMTIIDGEVARRIIAARFRTRFEAIGFQPPYATWPVKESAFSTAKSFTPRGLLMVIYAHVDRCAETGVVEELQSFGEIPLVDGPGPGPTPPPPADDLGHFDTRFEELKGRAEIHDALREDREDTEMPRLLGGGLKAWVLSRSLATLAYQVDPPPGEKPALHARLRLMLEERIEDQVRWGFRAIAAKSPVAALNRLRKAATEAGLVEGQPKRKLVLLRNTEWNTGAKTQEALEAFRNAGGLDLPVSTDDLRTLWALHKMVDEDRPDLQAWLFKRRPADDVDIFRQAFADAEGVPVTVDDPLPHPSEDHPRTSSSPGRASIVLGRSADGQRTLSIDLESLRKHTAIFAGSGSGKTVLIRRLIEECALQGVSTIVLDPNSDLARLGDPWPQAPSAWGADDAARAGQYLADTDVVVWTPRRESGRPLTFQPLPDFRAVKEDADEFNEAVEAAVASIIPRANLEGRAAKVHLKRAVLRNAVQYYGRSGGNRLNGLIELLRDLPDGVSQLEDAGKLGSELAQTLTAAMVNDPLFGGDGVPVDPGRLLTPPPGKRARVSVISMVGLQSESERQSFVNQLQMALFAWLRKHPANDRPLGGLFVMDEAQTLAPSGAMTACTQSTLALVSQARKYGLGMVFATQAPKGLHNRIPGNTATQFFGLLNAPVQIAAAREMAQAKGGDVSDISLLKSGQFYAAVEGEPFMKVHTPLCLSHHPSSPLSTEEVLDRARQTVH